MWAGGRFWFKQPLILGIDSLKNSIILSVKEKDGSSGQLCFVTVKHEYFQNETLCLIEEHDIVYREDPKENDKLIDGLLLRQTGIFMRKLPLQALYYSGTQH